MNRPPTPSADWQYWVAKGYCSALRTATEAHVAAEAASHEGVNRTSTELCVEERTEGTNGSPGAAAEPAPPAFVELVAPQTQSQRECTIELQGRQGKLRIQLKSASPSYLATLSRQLWKSASRFRSRRNCASWLR